MAIEGGSIEVAVTPERLRVVVAVVATVIIGGMFLVVPGAPQVVTGKISAVDDVFDGFGGVEQDPEVAGQDGTAKEAAEQDETAMVKPGPRGSAHEHAAFVVAVGNRRVDFSQRAFQLRDEKVHFESGNGTVIHTHATNVTVGYALSTLNMSLTGDCLVLGTRKFCEDAGAIRVVVNGNEVENGARHVIRDGDGILIHYQND